MLLTVNATGSNVTPLQLGLSDKEDTRRVDIVVYLSGTSYSSSQLDALLYQKAGKSGFEWLSRSGTLWSIDADQLRLTYPELKPLSWFKGQLITSYSTEFDCIKGPMGNLSPNGHGLSIVGNHAVTKLAFILDADISSDSNRIFYSWMSDHTPFSNRNFIEDCLKRAVKQISRDERIGITPSLDRDTQGEKGSPDIANTVFKKINSARAFVADVTLVAFPLVGWRKWLAQRIGTISVRSSPNPNVLVELGFAAGILGWERCLLVVNTAFGSVEQLPFDLRGRRIITYHVARRADRKAARTSFVPLLKSHLVEALDLKGLT